MRHDRYVASILINHGSIRLREHNVTVSQDGSTTECWIVSQDNECYRIKVAQDPKRKARSNGFTRVKAGPWPDTSAIVFIDGSEEEAGSMLLNAGDRSDILMGVTTSNGMMRPFMFAPIVTTDAEDVFLSCVNNRTGTIEINIHRGREEKPTKRARANSLMIPERDVSADPGSDEAHPYNEKKVRDRMLSHTTGYGRPIRMDDRGGVTAAWRDRHPESKPFHTFRFHYKTKALLQADGIIARQAPAVLAAVAPAAPIAARSLQRNATPGPSGTRHLANNDPILISDSESDDDELTKALLIAHARNEAKLAKTKAAIEQLKAEKAVRKNGKLAPQDVKLKIEDTDKDRAIPSLAPVIQPKAEEEDAAMAPPADPAEAVDDGASDASLNAVEVKTEAINEDDVPRWTAQQKGKKRVHGD